ncbi:transposase [Micrococcus luteus]|uniref:transposase n=1 Tax=Micrococcus luteus TaxID=1270 RepID=UPI0034C6C19F
MPKKFDPEVKDRAVRMVLDRVEEAGSVTKAVALVSPKVDVGRETLRRWVCQHRVDAGLKDGPTSDDLAELKRLRGEVKRLREDNEILRRSSPLWWCSGWILRWGCQALSSRAVSVSTSLPVSSTGVRRQRARTSRPR